MWVFVAVVGVFAGTVAVVRIVGGTVEGFVSGICIMLVLLLLDLWLAYS